MTQGFDLYQGQTIELEDDEDLASQLGDMSANPESTQDGSDLLETLSKMTIHDMMLRMRKGLVMELLARLETGTATHQELAIIQRTLNDAGYVIDRDPDGGSEPGSTPMKSSTPLDLPDLSEQDYE